MAFIIKDRVKENTTSTGTGAVSLGGAAATFDTFQSYLTNGDTTYYAIAHTTSGTDEWEVGLGTWNTGNTLTRTTVLAGSNGTSAVTFSAGPKDVFMTYPAAHAALAGDDVDFANITVTGTVDGRDVAADGTKLDTVEANADVTDAINVAAAGALMRSGGTMTGSLILSADPTTALGAATKEYVDTIAAAGIHYHLPVRVETPSALTVTYNNGSSGAGATLTNSGTQAVLSIDGVTLSAADRVLVYQQSNAAHNGIYTVTNTGSGSTNWVLTRATDADSYGTSDPDALGEGDAFFVKEGMTGAGELYVMNTSGTITFGTTNISFTVIAETAVYSAGTGLTLTGTTFSIGQDVGTSSNVTFNQVTANIIGNVTGNVTGNITGNAGTATKLATARTVQLTGDVTGSATFDGSVDINITASVQDDSHAHIISNVDGLQTALDAKTPTSRIVTAGNGLTGGGDLTANRTFTVGSGTGVTVNANDIAIGQDVATTATPTFAGLTTTGDLNFGDNDKALFGDGSDLQIYHSGSSSYVLGGNTGDLVIEGSSLRLRADDNTNYFRGIDGTATYLYHPDATNGIKLATTSTGVDVTGVVTADSLDVNGGTIDGTVIGGTTPAAGSFTGLTSSAGITVATASGYANIEVGGPSGAYIDLKAPASDDYDARIMYDITAANLTLTTQSASEPVVLAQGGATKLSTTSTGVDVTGTITSDGLGVGSGTPSKSLDVNTASATFRIRDASSGNDFSVKTIAGPVSLAGSESSTAIGFMTNDTERMRIGASGGVAVTGNITATGTIAPAGGVVLSGWTITESGGVLYFATGGVNKMKIDASGNITTVGNITAFGTI
jgi:hypothetical protein